jgi:hypothetical protein
MSETPRKPPAGSKRRVREIIESEPPYMPDEPSVIGTPDSLYDDECEKGSPDEDKGQKREPNPGTPRSKNDRGS